MVGMDSAFRSYQPESIQFAKEKQLALHTINLLDVFTTSS